MAWRDDPELGKALRYLCHGVGSYEEVFAALLAMPDEAKVALARELLKGTGRVVAMRPLTLEEMWEQLPEGFREQLRLWGLEEERAAAERERLDREAMEGAAS